MLNPKIIANLVSRGVIPLMNLADNKIVNYGKNSPLAVGGEGADRVETRRCVLLFWHEFILTVGSASFHDDPITALCSSHRDGELVGQSAMAMGMRIVSGSTTRGGAKAIRQLKQAAKFSSILVTPDGPKGPRRQMAAGAVFLAAKIGLPIVPVGVGVSSAYRLGTWDRFAVPLPGARIRLIMGPEIFLPRRLRKDELESHRLSCQRLLGDVSDHAQAWADSGADIPGQRRYVRRRPAAVVSEHESPAVEPKMFGQGMIV